jgi:hypothetical protein
MCDHGAAETALMPELDLTFSQTIVIAVLSGSVAGGVVSGGINLLSERLKRQHERNTRIRAERKEIYRRLVRLVGTLRRGVQQAIFQGQPPERS